MAALLSGCGAGEEPPRREILLLSGRDDHGLVAEPLVALSHEPEGRGHAHAVRHGTLVRVVATRGEWAHVRTLEGASVDGWVNDYYLRGVVHACAPSLPWSAQVELRALDGALVHVRTVEDEREATVARASLSEVPCPPKG